MADVKLEIDVNANTGAANAGLSSLAESMARVTELLGSLSASISGTGVAMNRLGDHAREAGSGEKGAADGADRAKGALDRLNAATGRNSSSMRNFTARIREASRAMSTQLAQSAANLGRSLGSSALNFTKLGVGTAAAALGIGASMGAATAAVVRLGAAQEQTRQRFEVLLGSAAKGNKLFGQLKEFANVTPFSTNEVVKAGQTLLSFGVAAGDVQDTLLKVGNAAAATGVNVAEMAAIYGKAMVKGKVEAETLNQFSERGVPIIKALAKQMGVAEKEIYKLSSKGKIGANDLRKAFFSLSEAGGAYSGMMDKLGKSVGGMWSTLQGKISDVAATLGEQFMPVIQKCLAKVIEYVDKVSEAVSSGDFMEGIAQSIAKIMPVVAEGAKFIVDIVLGTYSVFKAVFNTVAGIVAATVGTIISIISQLTQFLSLLGGNILAWAAMIVDKIASVIGRFLGEIVRSIQDTIKTVLSGAVAAYNKVASLLHWDQVELEMGDWGSKVEESLGGAGKAMARSMLDGAQKALDIAGKAEGAYAYGSTLMDEGEGMVRKGAGTLTGMIDKSDAAGKWIDRIAGKITGWASGFSKNVKANAKKQAEDADKATLDKAAPEKADKDIVGDRGITRKVDSLAKVGLYNFSRSAEDNLDLRRNNLLEAIRNGIDRMASQGQGGQVRAMPALGSV